MIVDISEDDASWLLNKMQGLPSVMHTDEAAWERIVSVLQSPEQQFAFGGMQGSLSQIAADIHALVLELSGNKNMAAIIALTNVQLKEIVDQLKRVVDSLADPVVGVSIKPGTPTTH